MDSGQINKARIKYTRLTEVDERRFAELARREQTSQSELLRRAVRLLLAQFEKGDQS